jgi:hypothetical protein
MIGNDPRYQTIIDAYRRGEFDAPYQSMDYTPSPYYNPIYDIRREQIKAGELEEGARFPKPLIDTAPKEEEQQEEQFDPCPPGYQLVDGVCQPDSMFQPSSGDGGETTPFDSPYYGDIYLPMAGGMAQGDPNVPYGEYRTPTVNTELMRFAAQGDYQPTFGSSMQDLFRKGMQFSPVMGLLNAFGLGPSYTQTVTPRFTGGGFDPLATAPTPVPGAYQEAVVPETLAALDVTNPLIRSGASQPAVESVTRAMTNQAVQAAAQQRFKEAQQQDRGQSAGERAREAQRRSQSVQRDISTGSRIRGGI